MRRSAGRWTSKSDSARAGALTRVLVRAGAGLALVSLTSVAALVWVSSSRAIAPGTTASPWSLRDFPTLRPEDVTVDSATGVKLVGRFFRGDRPATVVLSHGYGGTQDELLPVVAALHQAGLSAFTYDLRGCGRSGGNVTFGDREAEDLVSVVGYLRSRRDVDGERIGAFGFSMGGATTLLAAAEDDRIAAVAADSAWSDASHWLRPSWRQALARPIAPFSSPSLALTQWRTGADLRALRPVASVARIAPRPLLLIAGEADTVVPASDSKELYAAARKPKDLWWLQGAGHGATFEAPGYSDRVASFFRRTLDRDAGDSKSESRSAA